MRFARYEHRGALRTGAIDEDDRLHPVDGDPTLRALLEYDALESAGAAALAAAPGPPLAEVRLGPPLEPASLRDFVTFEEHVEGVRRSVDGSSAGVPDEWYAAPTFYFSNPHAVLGDGDEVPMPPGSSLLDYELEVAAVVGRPGRDLSPARARAHIAGYLLFNDWSARDLQSAEMRVGLGPCKGKDFAGSLGPVLVTADELEPHRDADGLLRLGLTAAVNGRVVGSDLMSNMSWTFEEMLAHASRGATLRPGDVLGSGTCGNGGCLAELWGVRGRQDPPPLAPGDTVALTAEGIGTLTNTVVAGADVEPVPPARRRPRERP